MSTNPHPHYYWVADDAPSGSSTSSGVSNTGTDMNALCLGTGRFLRSVLVPALVGAGMKVGLIQTRGRSMMEYMYERSNSNSNNNNTTYEVDTVLPDGSMDTAQVPIQAVFSLGQEQDKQACFDFLLSLKKQQQQQGGRSRISILGVGVTEAGLASKDTQAMKDLYQLLEVLCELQQQRQQEQQEERSSSNKLVVLDMDNVPNNGSLMQSYMHEYAAAAATAAAAAAATAATNKMTKMTDFLQHHVVFCDTMVDRITSQRPGSDGMVPRCEPLPMKALVILCNDSPSTSSTQAGGGGGGVLPAALLQQPGVIGRTTQEQLQEDIALKLRIANGTHTAIAHALALLGHLQTDVLSTSTGENAIFMRYLDALVQDQILASLKKGGTSTSTSTSTSSTLYYEEGVKVWDDWRRRLIHPHFGLSTFFITQNGTAKGGIRWGPTVVDLMTMMIQQQQQQQQDNGTATTTATTPQVSLAMAYAILLRWLTPLPSSIASSSTGIYRGWLEGANPKTVPTATGDDTTFATTVEYADGLRYDLTQGWYEFKCPLPELVEQLQACVSSSSSSSSPSQPFDCIQAVQTYLLHEQGGNLSGIATNQTTRPAFLDDLVQAIAVLYARLIAGDGLLALLQELDCPSSSSSSAAAGIGFTTPCSALSASSVVSPSSCSSTSASTTTSSRRGILRLLHYQPCSIPDTSRLMSFPVTNIDALASVVENEVQSVVAVDLHTHLLPPTHGPLCLWGIDELLTYHYLVAEYFMTAPPSMTPEGFYAKSKQDQADIIWKALFIDRSPLSEACRGVLTTLCRLGLAAEVGQRDLHAIRRFYQSFRDRPDGGAHDFCELAFRESGIEYAIMTNIPFDSQEASYWRPKPTEYSKRFRSALRVDPLLAGDRKTIETTLRASGYDLTLEGARQYLRDWCDTMKPEYMMASTPHDFVLPAHQAGSLSKTNMPKNKMGLNQEAMKQPGAFATMSSAGGADHVSSSCDGAEDEAPSVIDEHSDFLSQVLMKICEERDLPIALKIGAHRGVNPRLQAAGDGVVAFCDGTMLARLCTRFPKVRFLATFLSRNNQHEACVLASKFPNLFLYGCWWFCNNPSIIHEITTMRVEMLGTAFMAQHSDARVVDQLLYKWPHSRAVIARVLIEEYTKSLESGWLPTRAEIRRDVRRLFRGSYEEFMTKSLI